MRVGIGAGHGGNDPGACANGWIERDVARRVVERLIADGRAAGADVVSLTVDEGYPGSVTKPALMANAAGCDIAFQVHFNAGGGNGTEMLHYPGNSALAAQLSADIASVCGLPNRGAKSRPDLGFIKTTDMQAIMPELAFVDCAGNVDAVVNNLAAVSMAFWRNLGVSIGAPAVVKRQPEINPNRGRIGENDLLYVAHVAELGTLPYVDDGIWSGTHGGSLGLQGVGIDTRKVQGGILRLGLLLHTASFGWRHYGEIDGGTIYGQGVGQGKAVEYLAPYIIENTTGKDLFMQIHQSGVGDSKIVAVGYDQALAFMQGLGSTGLGRAIEAYRLWLE